MGFEANVSQGGGVRRIIDLYIRSRAGHRSRLSDAPFPRLGLRALFCRRV